MAIAKIQFNSCLKLIASSSNYSQKTRCKEVAYLLSMSSFMSGKFVANYVGMVINVGLVLLL